MTDQEKEEDYEFNLHISTFTSGDPLTEGQKPIQIENSPTEQQSVTPIEQNITVPTQQQEEGREQIEEDIPSNNPNYAMTKENLRKIAK